MKGDFDNSGFASLGDAVHVANMRLDYGDTQINPFKGDCMEGDFDNDGVFTIGDAAYVALVQFGKAIFHWPMPEPSCLTADACKSAAVAQGLGLGGLGDAFEGDYAIKGCYTYPEASDYYGMAFFGTGGTPAEMWDEDIDGKRRVYCPPVPT